MVSGAAGEAAELARKPGVSWHEKASVGCSRNTSRDLYGCFSPGTPHPATQILRIHLVDAHGDKLHAVEEPLVAQQTSI